MTEFDIERIVLKEVKEQTKETRDLPLKPSKCYESVYALPKKAGTCFEWDPCDNTPKNNNYTL